MRFKKYHGNGNDFIFLSSESLSPFKTLPALREFVKNSCHRQRGVGADGVVFYDLASFGLLIVNSDGSFAGTCGNALRCFGLMLLELNKWDGNSPCLVSRLVPPGILPQALAADEQFLFDNQPFANLVKGCTQSAMVSVAMGQETHVEKINLTEAPHLSSNPHALFVQLANPHLVFVTDEFASFSQEDFSGFGKWAQTDLCKLTPSLQLSNISMLFLKEGNWHLTVYERGAGLTLCCGSGAVASRVALEYFGKLPPQAPSVTLELPGGRLEIKNYEHNGQVQRLLSGLAAYVYEGDLPLTMSFS